MIARIDIPDFGLFRNYSWSASIGNSESFRRMNILYGRNYSGKTTLSRIFKSLEDGVMHRHYESGSFSITFSDGKVATPQQLQTSFQVRVYNSDFVKENLSWLHNDDGTIKPFTILGARNVELDKKIKEIESKLGSKDEKTGLLYILAEKEAGVESRRNKYQSRLVDLEDKLKRKANDKIKIDNNLFVVTTSKRSYTIADIKSDIAGLGNDWAFYKLDRERAEMLRELLKERPLNDISILSESSPNFSKHYEKTKELLERKIRPSVPIAELMNDSLLQEWVRQGIDRHKGKRKACGFCGNMIGEDLWEQLDAHFSKESEGLRREIKTQVEGLSRAKQGLAGFLKLSKDLIYPSLSAKCDATLKNWIAGMAEYERNIDVLINRLRDRERDIFNDRPVGDVSDVSASIFEAIKEFNKLIGEHNEKTKRLGSDQAEARLALRRLEIVNFLTDIGYKDQLTEIQQLKSECEEAEKELPGLLEEVNRLQTEKITLEAQTRDESKGAELVNQHLSHFFGHNELRLVAEGEKASLGFRIQREGADANNLSEGECSLISFCYFVARIEDELKDATNSTKLIVYIDDPISSLDSNHIFFMFSLIESVIAQPMKYGQLFVSTHNLDFLKYLRKLTIPQWKPQPNSGKKQDIRHFIVVRKNKGTTELLPAPDYLKEYITEFNFLFNQIYNCSISDTTTISHEYLYNFGNNMRKFLEAYLFYRYPTHNWSIGQRIKKFFNDDGLSSILINRVINEYSHMGEQFERGMEPVDVDEIKKIAILVIEKIK